MAMEVEEAFPSFSTQRIRSTVQSRDGMVTQRRLNYNAPLLSVRRLADGNGDANSKVWKLSAELSKEPLRVPGAVPFTWEHTPGQPKQAESPPHTPSSPSAPSTPSPPSARRASPASPTLPSPPPPLRPLFLRSNSPLPSPPPPPPPPLPRTNPLPIEARKVVPRVGRSVSFSACPPPPPPLPPPFPLHQSTVLKVNTQASTTPALQNLPDHERMGAFRLVDPTEGFLHLLRARRLKAEPHEFLPAEALNEAEEVRHKAAALVKKVEETLKNSAKCGLSNDSISEVASIKDSSRGVKMDAIIQGSVVEHCDVVTEEASSIGRQDEEAMEKDDQASLDAVNSVDPPCQHGKHDTVEQREDTIASENNPCRIVPLKEDADYVSVVQATCSDEMAEEALKVELTLSDGLANENVPLSTRENGSSVCVHISPSVDHRVQLDAGHKKKVIDKQQNRRCTNSIAILDSCSAESMQMIKSTVLEFCRKATAASLRTLAKAKQKFAASSCTSSAIDVVVSHNASRIFYEGHSGHQKEEAVVSEEKTTVQEQFSQETQQQDALVSIPHGQSITSPRSSQSITSPRSSLPIASPRSSTVILQESMESFLCDRIPADAKRVCTPVSSPKPSTARSPPHRTIEAEEKNISSSPPSHFSPNGQGSPSSQPPQQKETLEIWLRASSMRHVYSKSLGGDEPNEFYDASNRFGSWGSTPSRLLPNRSMSKDWSDVFLDATSTPFESPRTSVSDIRCTMSNAEHAHSPPKASKSTRPTSKLSKRVGKSLRVETRGINATGEAGAMSKDETKGFISGEMYARSKESGLVLNKKEVNDTRRKWVSGDQASSSASEAGRQYKRGMPSRSMNGKSSSHTIAVTPVFPSKCQKNRLMASASGLPQQISTVSMEDIGWPLGISGYPPVKTSTKGKEEMKERGATKGDNNVVVPLPPLPPSPAGGSWLRKALSSNQAPPGLAGLNAAAKKVESIPSPGMWEDIVKGSHIQPGHLRFSEELHHHPPSKSTSTQVSSVVKYKQGHVGIMY